MVATVAPDDATTTLFFGNLSRVLPFRIVRMGVHDVAHPLRTLRAELEAARLLAGAAAVILVRELFEFEGLARTARSRGIPCYYFMDDNFMVLRDEPYLEDARHGREYSHERVRAALRDFSGVLLSTESLVGYFRHWLHDSTVLYPPVRGHAPDVRRARNDGELTIAFFGGQHRRDPFVRHVFPAICRLAEDRPVVLHAAGIDLSGLAVPERLRVVPVPFNPSYPDALREMAARGADVLLHPSSDTRNNRYKNCHFLINARALGAAPIFSDVAPYDALRGEEVCLLCKNDQDAWHDALKRAADDAALRAALQASLSAYCDRHFGGADNIRVIRSILQDHRPPSAASRAARTFPIAMRFGVGLAQKLAARILPAHS